MRAVSQLRHEYPLEGLLKLADIPRSTYYYILKRLDKQDKYVRERQEIHVINAENKGRYGYRRITIELRKRGFVINHKVVMRLMKEENLTCRVRKKKYRSYRGTVGTVAPNIIDRNFYAANPYEKLATDITEFSLFGKKLYLCPLLDMYNGEIIAYAVNERPVLQLVTDMLKKGLSVIPHYAKPIVHSDQGWHYQHRVYQNLLQTRGFTQSMSRKGNCLDNSVIESFFGLLKSELLYLQDFESMDDFIKQLVEYIDYYNRQRIKTKLKGMSPVEYRTHSLKSA